MSYLFSGVCIVCNVAKLFHLGCTYLFIFPGRIHGRSTSYERYKKSHGFVEGKKLVDIRSNEHASNTQKLQTLSSDKVCRQETVYVGHRQVESVWNKLIFLCNLETMKFVMNMRLWWQFPWKTYKSHTLMTVHQILKHAFIHLNKPVNQYAPHARINILLHAIHEIRNRPSFQLQNIIVVFTIKPSIHSNIWERKSQRHVTNLLQIIYIIVISKHINLQHYTFISQPNYSDI